jgi:hypothetical protein
MSEQTAQKVTPEYGVFLYGYNRIHAIKIVEALAVIVNNPVALINAAGMENRKVSDILEEGGTDTFTSSDTQVLMFLGFDGPAIRSVLNGFPRGDIKRPIFCTLTPKNINWKLDYLLEHLKEEDQAAKKQQPGK